MKLCPPTQDLSQRYKELLQKKTTYPTKKQPNGSNNFGNFDSLNGDITIEEIN